MILSRDLTNRNTVPKSSVIFETKRNGECQQFQEQELRSGPFRSISSTAWSKTTFIHSFNHAFYKSEHAWLSACVTSTLINKQSIIFVDSKLIDCINPEPFSK